MEVATGSLGRVSSVSHTTLVHLRWHECMYIDTHESLFCSYLYIVSDFHMAMLNSHLNCSMIV